MSGNVSPPLGALVARPWVAAVIGYEMPEIHSATPAAHTRTRSCSTRTPIFLTHVQGMPVRTRSHLTRLTPRGKQRAWRGGCRMVLGGSIERIKVRAAVHEDAPGPALARHADLLHADVAPMAWAIWARVYSSVLGHCMRSEIALVRYECE